MLLQGRRLTGVEHLTRAAEACGFAVTQLDMAALPFAQQLQVGRHCTRCCNTVPPETRACEGPRIHVGLRILHGQVDRSC
jgi:hypothetical protein